MGRMTSAVNFPFSVYRVKPPAICDMIFAQVRRPILFDSMRVEAVLTLLDRQIWSVFFLLQNGDGDGLGGIGVFADVVSEIIQHALKIGDVDLNVGLRLRQEQLDGKALLLQLHAAFAEQLLEDQRRVEPLELQRQPAAEEQGTAEQLVRQVFELLGLTVGGGQIALQLLRGGYCPLLARSR